MTTAPPSLTPDASCGVLPVVFTTAQGLRRVGPLHPPLLIAEAGVNHDGCPATALRLVEAATEAGADFVKFQLFTAAEIASVHARPTTGQTAACGAQSQRDMLAALELSDDAWRAVHEHCRRCGVAMLVTPFSERDVARAVQLGVTALKIASPDIVHLPLLDAAAETSLPLIVSTGTATLQEIDAAVTHLRCRGAGDRLVLLHCVSAYPTPVRAARLGAIRALQQRWKVPAGFSDHTRSVAMGAWAVASGACVLEKHFTLDRTRHGPDHSMSLEPHQLQRYGVGARRAFKALGLTGGDSSGLESEVRRLARRSIVTRRPVAAGETLTRSMLALKRPGTGIGPDRLDEVVGCVARRPIAGDVLLAWEMLQRAKEGRAVAAGTPR